MDDPKDEDMTFIDPDDDVIKLGYAYSKNQTIFLNMKYKVTKNFGWGLEFINFTTTVAQGTDATSTTDFKGQRFTASWWYAF